MSLPHRIKTACELRGQFTLRSGQTADRYFDKYQFEADPILLSDIARELVPLLPPGTQILCGLEMGGIPLVTMLSHHTGLPAAFIRKQPKTYGTCRYAEGASLPGKKIVLIEDVVTSGGAIADAAKMLRSDGIQVDTALCVIDRQTGGTEALKEIDIELRSLVTASEIDSATGDTYQKII